MNRDLLVLIVLIVVFAVMIFVSILRAKKAKKKAAIDKLQVKFMNLQAQAKAINEAYLRESSEYLMYSAPDAKSEEKIRVDLLNILARYKEAGKLSKDDFYDKAYEVITKK